MTNNEREIGRLERDIEGIGYFLKYFHLELETLNENAKNLTERLAGTQSRIIELRDKRDKYIALLPELQKDLKELKNLTPIKS